MTEAVTDRVFRSVSQLKQYRQCGYQYWLARFAKDEDGQRIWQRPAAWFPQGTGVHEAVDWWEKTGRTGSLEEMQLVYTEAFDRAVSEYTEQAPNFDEWFGSGWRYPAVKDLPRRFDIGLEQVEKYFRYYTEKHPDEVLYRTHDGQPFVEVGFELQLGEVWVRGYIDQVYWDPEGRVWRVRDVKTGKNPGDETQLAVYAVVVNEEYGTAIDSGDYWMARTGKPTLVYDLRAWPKSRIIDEFAELEEGVRAERFEPNPSKENCMFCPVQAACDYAALS